MISFGKPYFEEQKRPFLNLKWWIWRLDGFYFLTRCGFGLNEGRFPNIVVYWAGVLSPFFRMALSKRWIVKWP